MLSYDLAILWPKLFGVSDRAVLTNPIGPPETSSGSNWGSLPRACPIDWQRGTRRLSRFHTFPSLFSTIGAHASIHGRAWWNPLQWCQIRSVKWRRSSPPAGTVARRCSSTVNRCPLAWLVQRLNHMPRSSGIARTRLWSKQESVPEAGILVLLDSDRRRLGVLVDGQATRLLRANGLFRGVRLAPGRHTVLFTFRPRSFFVGVAISSIALVVMVGLFVTSFRRKAKPVLDVTSQPAGKRADTSRTAARDMA